MLAVALPATASLTALNGVAAWGAAGVERTSPNAEEKPLGLEGACEEGSGATAMVTNPPARRSDAATGDADALVAAPAADATDALGRAREGCCCVRGALAVDSSLAAEAGGGGGGGGVAGGIAGPKPRRRNPAVGNGAAEDKPVVCEPDRPVVWQSDPSLSAPAAGASGALGGGTPAGTGMLSPGLGSAWVSKVAG